MVHEIFYASAVKTESKIHYFTRCNFYNIDRATLMHSLRNIDGSLSVQNDNNFIKSHLIGNYLLLDNKNIFWLGKNSF